VVAVKMLLGFVNHFSLLDACPDNLLGSAVLLTVHETDRTAQTV
jgi:hypothetical protein